MKKPLIKILLALLIFLPAASVSADIVIPPPTCDHFQNTRTQGSTFSLKGPGQYPDGLLRLNFEYQNYPSSSFNMHSFIMKAENCEFVKGTEFFFNNLIPESITDFSIRFITDTSFQIFDDNTNQPIDCPACSVNFDTTAPPPFKFSFFISDDNTSSNIESAAFYIRSADIPVITPVLFIPGTVGTEMKKGEELLWPNISKMFTDFGDQFMDPLAFNSQIQPSDSSVEPTEVISKPDERFDYTEKFKETFTQNGYTLDENFFLMPYDWRDDIAKNATTTLKNNIDLILSQTGQDKIDVIAHSQGGLLIKRLLYEMPDYQSKIRKLVFLGTPHLGSPKSGKVLLYGDSLNVKLVIIGLDPDEIKKISQNMPAIYQMLPSQEYFEHDDGYLGEYDRKLFGPDQITIYDYNTTKQKLKDKELNSTLIDQSEIFHTQHFDNFDAVANGIETYSIMGCQAPTLNAMVAKKFGRDVSLYGPGDGTVPVFSASNTNSIKNYYTLSLEDHHGLMPSMEGIRQQLFDIVSGGSLPVSGITEDINDCHFEGQQVSLHSPVELHIYDEFNNHVGPMPDGMFEHQIPEVAYDIFGEEKYAFLPNGHTYFIKLKALDNGSFSFYNSIVDGNEVIETEYYSDVPISNNSLAETELGQHQMSMDFDGDGNVDSYLEPTFLDQTLSQDSTPPVSTSTLSGLMASPGVYKSDVEFSLSAEDPQVEGQEYGASGLFKTLFSLDNGAFQEYSGTTTVATSGPHILKFYSIDNAGNQESEQTLNFTISKAPPQFTVKYDPNNENFKFEAEGSQVSCTNKDCTAADGAGNTTKIFFRQALFKNLKTLMLDKVSYNGQSSDITNNLFTINLLKDKFNQLLLVKNQEIARVEYNAKKDESKVFEFQTKKPPKTYTLPGKKLIKIFIKGNTLESSIE